MNRATLSSLVCLTLALGLVSCSGSPPVPCTSCSGQCVDLQTDSANCGTCGTSCAAGARCVAGACALTCSTGQTACGTSGCFDLKHDPKNCGGCGMACASGELCNEGSCQQCPAGLDACNGTCTNEQTDSSNCGACGTVCAMGTRCAAGACVPSCGVGGITCAGADGGNACVDAQNDSRNCGTCGHACAATERCVSGACATTCGGSGIACTVGNGSVCVDPHTDPANCGACGLACSPQNVTAPLCSAGACSYGSCLPGFTDCDGDPKNGCETPTSQCVTLVSVGLDGGAANGRSFGGWADRSGTKVVFFSEASNLVPNDTNGAVDVFLRDLNARTTVRLSTLPDGGEVPLASAGYWSAAISGDGKVVAVSTIASLITPDTNGAGYDVIVFEADGGRSYGMRANGTGAQPAGNTETFADLYLSDDGRIVTYMTRANNLFVATNGTPPGESNVYQFDRVTQATTAVSLTSTGAYATSGFNGFNAFPTFASSNGRYVTFVTFGAGMVPLADNGCSHAYLSDRVDANTRLLTRMRW